MEFKRHFGQNFLNNFHLAKKFVESAEINEQDIIIEVGPGNGSVTERIIKKNFRKLILIEIDEELIPYLKEKFNSENIEIIHASVLDINFDELTNGEKYKVIGALPYNISKKIINKIIESENYITASVIIQKEVADKYLEESSNFLGAFIHSYAETNFLFDLFPHYFIPQPKVMSTAIVIKNAKKYPDPKFVKFLKQAFINPNKTLKNNLKHINGIDEIMDSLKLNAKIRPRELDLKTFFSIYKATQK